MHTIRQDLLIQAQVEKRLKELAEAEKSGTQKQKSLRGGPVEVLVPNKVKWPHEYVLSGSHKERVSYDQLSIIQWVTGFCRIMRDEQDKTIQNSMLDYLIALFDDANDFSWDAAKASHAVLLCRMEQGEIKNYAQVDKIDRIRRANAQRHSSLVSTPSQMAGSKKYTSKSTKSMPCQYYNQGSCVHQKSHDTHGTLYKHICTHCFATSGKTFAHPESHCRTKHTNHTRKGLVKSISKIKSIPDVTLALHPQTNDSSTIANKQSCANKRLVHLKNEQTHSHKAQHNTCHIPTSHIPTSNRFQILQDLNADTIRNSVLIPSMHQSVHNPPIEPTKVDATGRASKSRLPKVSQVMISNERPQVVNQLTTALMPTLDMQENSVQLGNKNKTGLIPRG